MHEYLGGTVRGLGGVAEQIGGVRDHVHLLIGLKATHGLAEVVREVKKASSRWAEEAAGKAWCGWQEGYAAFTVSPSGREAVAKYVANQEEHHRSRSFQEELAEMLERAGVAYDARYLD